MSQLVLRLDHRLVGEGLGNTTPRPAPVSAGSSAGTPFPTAMGWSHALDLGIGHPRQVESPCGGCDAPADRPLAPQDVDGASSRFPGPDR
jgi:hypothetical protein